MNTCCSRPVYIKTSDKNIPTNGPEMAKSNNELKFGGGVLSGVMHPVSPS